MVLLRHAAIQYTCILYLKQEITLLSMVSTITYPLLSLRNCERDGDMLKEALIFLLTNSLAPPIFSLLLRHLACCAN